MTWLAFDNTAIFKQMIYAPTNYQLRAYQLPITRLSITNYQLSITNYQLSITNYQLPITNYQLPITNYQLPIQAISGGRLLNLDLGADC